ncbi:uncharacterized protein DS421_5g147300 [Arachis hypogaea]|nr:uncharacterized protein DS421_5g147300 [Arachis hypogaea]
MFNLHWNFNVSSPKIQLQSINAFELARIHMFLELWCDQPLSLRDILADEHVAWNAIFDMSGGLEAIIAMKRRLAASQANAVINSGGGDKVSSSATLSNILMPPRFNVGADSEKEFQALEFIDEYLMIDEIKSGMAKLPLKETLPHVQRMLLRSAIYIRDAEKEVVNFHSKYLGQEKELKKAKAQV